MKLNISKDRLKILEQIGWPGECIQNSINKITAHFTQNYPIPSNYCKETEIEIETPGYLYQYFHSMTKQKMMNLLIDIYAKEVLNIDNYNQLYRE